MNIAVLSRGEHLYSTQSLIKAGMARNHVMEVMEPSHCTLTAEDGKPQLYYCNETVDDLHAVIPRVGASNTYYGSSLVRHFQAMGVFCVVGAEPILQSRNKWTCFQILSNAKIPVPKTILGNAYDMQQVLNSFNKAPVIIKVLQGTHGHGVILAETYTSALSTIETLKASKVRFVIQEYIAESNGADLRAIVVDGQVVAAFWINPLLVLTLPILIYAFGLRAYNFIFDTQHRVGFFYSKYFIYGYFGVAILFWILRNLPWPPFDLLSPSVLP